MACCENVQEISLFELMMSGKLSVRFKMMKTVHNIFSVIIQL